MFKFNFKGFILGVLLTSLLMCSINTLAADVYKSISVVVNKVKLTVNGKPITIDNFLYNGTTYVPMRAVAETLGKEVGWDAKTNTASINDQGFVTPTATPQPTSYFFRSVNFGMTSDQVNKSEGNKLVKSTTGNVWYLYDTQINSRKGSLSYTFNEKNELYSIWFICTEEHTNSNDYITDFGILKLTLIQKYGEPQGTLEKDWDDDLYKDDPNYYGLAVITGHLTYRRNWQLENANINLLLMGDNYEATLVFLMSSTKIQPPKSSGSGL